MAQMEVVAPSAVAPLGQNSNVLHSNAYVLIGVQESFVKVILLKAICDLCCCFPLDSAKAQFIHVVDCLTFLVNL
ncbi:hypothetical protein LOK49_LG04G02766 [Camellia lanceoleosa]|uniref:Uncharacterized protein n=1 Tax=Camellia lanceoleosa TaxID=1840588 RepID=A0ACC0I758_9ERIC|nr:hypothetical protein LOK49_LG04G02766 [Camellia lanceoleosa]